MLTDWILSQRTNTFGHKPGAAQRKESNRSRGLLQPCLPELEGRVAAGQEQGSKDFVVRIKGKRMKKYLLNWNTGTVFQSIPFLLGSKHSVLLLTNIHMSLLKNLSCAHRGSLTRISQDSGVFLHSLTYPPPNNRQARC